MSCLFAAPVAAAELRLPPNASTLPSAIAASCSECNATGYTPCGSPAVQWVPRFALHAFLGIPPRAYLATFTMSGAEFRALARKMAYGDLLATLKERFAATRSS